MSTRVFIAELIQDLPLWVALIMSIYPHLQNEEIFYVSLGAGAGATLFLFQEMKRGNYNLDSLFERPSEAFAFVIYSLFLLIMLVVLTFQDRLYMGSLVWTYVIIGTVGELFFLRR
ncbi:MAG: hypothetical protein GXO05_06595 [Aquificae bacterium]|nr:hypothetical protein [Aquificota bacterium]